MAAYDQHHVCFLLSTFRDVIPPDYLDLGFQHACPSSPYSALFSIYDGFDWPLPHTFDPILTCAFSS